MFIGYCGSLFIFKGPSILMMENDTNVLTNAPNARMIPDINKTNALTAAYIHVKGCHQFITNFFS